MRGKKNESLSDSRHIIHFLTKKKTSSKCVVMGKWDHLPGNRVKQWILLRIIKKKRIVNLVSNSRSQTNNELGHPLRS